jgi:hypothetical protein
MIWSTWLHKLLSSLYWKHAAILAIPSSILAVGRNYALMLLILSPCACLLPFHSDSLTGGSIVGDMAPYQAFAIGGLGSVRGYGEGAVGSGRSCLVGNSELTFPLVCKPSWYL